MISDMERAKVAVMVQAIILMVGKSMKKIMLQCLGILTLVFGCCAADKGAAGKGLSKKDPASAAMRGTGDISPREIYIPTKKDLEEARLEAEQDRQRQLRRQALEREQRERERKQATELKKNRLMLQQQDFDK